MEPKRVKIAIDPSRLQALLSRGELVVQDFTCLDHEAKESVRQTFLQRLLYQLKTSEGVTP
ncbi:MAG: hypothetical protein MJA28_10030 [Gammaproteobacteria bacterium]|nr:hypothetical protein [Gammaproteobacteria bacterium]